MSISVVWNLFIHPHSDDSVVNGGWRQRLQTQMKLSDSHWFSGWDVIKINDGFDILT